MPTAQKKKPSVEDQLRALVRLQHIDNRIDQIHKLRGDLPEEIRDLEDEKAGLETRLENYKEELQEQEVAKRQAKLDIKEAEGLIEKYEEQQLEVRNNREFDALTKEIEGQKERISEAEDTIEEADETMESHQSAIEETEERLDELDKVLDEKRDELEEVVEDTEDEEKTLEELRDEASEKVDRSTQPAQSVPLDGRKPIWVPAPARTPDCSANPESMAVGAVDNVAQPSAGVHW